MSGDAPALLARLHAAWDALREKMDAAAKRNDWLAFRGMLIALIDGIHRDIRQRIEGFHLEPGVLGFRPVTRGDKS